MRKTTHFFLVLLAVMGLSTAWASTLPTTPTYTVQWTGETNVTYNGQPQNGLSASYVDGNSVSHTLTLTFTNGTEVITSPNYPVHAGAWTVTASTNVLGVILENTTAMLNIQPATVYVTGATAERAKFADGTLNGVVIDNGVLNGVFGNDNVDVLTTAIFSDANVGSSKTITLYYALVGDANTLNNYVVSPSSQLYTTSGVVIPNMLPNTNYPAAADMETQNGIEVSTYGYCTGTGYSIAYHLISGNPDQYRIDFADNRITDVDWTDLSTAGANGTLDITLPVGLPTGDYTMNVIFRDSRFPALESNPLTATVHANLSETYTMPLFNDVIALVDTCNCLSNIQWYHRGSAAEAWTAIPGATAYYYREEGGLTGEYFVSVTMNGVPTFTCPQTDMQTLIADESPSITVSAYPNPTTDNVNVTIDGSAANSHILRVISMMGAEIESRNFEGTTTTLDMRNYQLGNYMVSVDGMVVRVIKK